MMLGLCLAGAFGCQRSPETPAPKKLNVVLITLDTTRADYLGCYEPKRHETTPNFNRIAAEGVQFMHCISASSTTPVSHASILTGLYPYEHGLRVIYALSGCHLQPDVPYLPELLQRAGWQTGAFLSSFTVSEFYGFQRGFDVFDNGLSGDPQAQMLNVGKGKYNWYVEQNQRRSDHTTDAAIAWLKQLKPDQPFFLWVHYWDPHDWFDGVPETQPPPAFSAPFLRDVDVSPYGLRCARYEAEVAYVDSQFGRLVDELKSRGAYDSTLLIIIADHGEGLGDHDWKGHRLLYQEQIHVPLLVHGPGWPAGQRVDALARSIDVTPTVLAATGVTAPRPPTGATLRALVDDPAAPPRLAYADGPHKYDLNAAVVEHRPKDGNLYCLTDGRWKLIWRLDFPQDSELFDLEHDPQELHDAAREAPAELDRLRHLLEALNAFRTTPFPALNPVQPAAIHALRSLGYVGSQSTTSPAGPASQPTTDGASSDFGGSGG